MHQSDIRAVHFEMQINGQSRVLQGAWRQTIDAFASDGDVSLTG
jgi:hypothetical protein